MRRDRLVWKSIEPVEASGADVGVVGGGDSHGVAARGLCGGHAGGLRAFALWRGAVWWMVVLWLCGGAAGSVWAQAGAAPKPAPADPFVYAKPVAVQGKTLPKPESLRQAEDAGYAALQFGPGVGDVVYLTFDCRAKYLQHDGMYVYVPGHPVYGTPKAMHGNRDADGKVAFRKFELASVFGDYRVQYQVAFQNVSTDWASLSIGLPFRMDVTVVGADKQRTVFALVGRLKATLNGHALLEFARTLQRPGLDVAWVEQSGGMRVRGRIEMGDHALVPDSGFASWATILILEGADAAQVRLRDRFKIEPYGARGNFAYEPDPDRLKSARPYTAVVTVELAPLFGTVEGRAMAVLR